jgi:hypothetical protein
MQTLKQLQAELNRELELRQRVYHRGQTQYQPGQGADQKHPDGYSLAESDYRRRVQADFETSGR